MTLEEEINFINSSIIDEEWEGEGGNSDEVKKNGYDENNNNNHNGNNNTEIHPSHQTDDDEYFLPLITKRHKHKEINKRRKSKNMAERISQYS